MSIFNQYSRISHHTITTGSTFSVPPSEDFTDGTWTNNDLALSEIGVDELGSKVYIRVGSDVKEFNFATGSSGVTASSLTVGDGLTFSGSTLIANIGSGLTFSSGVLNTRLGKGLTFSSISENMINVGDGLTFSSGFIIPFESLNDKLIINIGSGLTFSSGKLSSPIGSTGSFQVSQNGIYSTGLGFYSKTNAIISIIDTPTALGPSGVFIGVGATAVGGNNVFIGNLVGASSSISSDNVFIGGVSGYNNQGSFGVFIGACSGYSNTISNDNTFIGNRSGYSNTTGNNNLFIGSCVGYSNTTGGSNTFIGYASGYNNTTGDSNTFIGYNTGPTSSITNSIAIGVCTQPKLDGEFAIASAGHPINTGATANSIVNYMCATINGTYYKIPLYD